MSGHLTLDTRAKPQGPECRPHDADAYQDHPRAAAILVAEDDPDALRLVTSLLQRAGYRVLTAVEGPQVLELIAKDRADLFLLDADLPGLSGFEVCRRLRGHPEFCEHPVIFLTALSDEDHKVLGFEVGGVDYVTKPVRKAELLARIRTHLELFFARRAIKRKALLLEKTTAEHLGDLDDLHRGQKSLLTDLSAFPDYRLGVRFQSAHQAGGDFYEIKRLGPDRLGLLVADVSGHDLSAPFITGGLKALVNTFFDETLGPPELMQRLNESLRRFLDHGVYVTACAVVYDRSHQEIEAVSAAHPPMMLIPAEGRPRCLDLVGDMLGMLERPMFQSGRYPVRPGDRLVLYSDGLIEGYRDPQGRRGRPAWGLERLAASLDARRDLSIDRLVEALVDEVLAENHEIAEDDIVVVGIEF